MTLSFRHVPAGKVKILVSLCINTFTLYIAIMDELCGVLVNMFGNNQPRDTCDNPTRNHAELAIIASWVTQLGIISSSVVPTSNC